MFFSGENVVSQNIYARACPYSEQKNNIGNEFLMQNILRKVVLLHTVFCREDEQNYKIARAAIFDLCMIFYRVHSSLQSHFLLYSNGLPCRAQFAM